MIHKLIPDLVAADDIANRIIANKRGYCPHKPHKKQAEFLALDDLEAFYGGAAGGGKSDALLMAALQYVHVPEYSALILRRTFRDLNQPKAILDRALTWLGPTDAKFNKLDKRFTFPSGATLTFGYYDKESDKDQYASAEFHFIGFDELTQFPEKWYLFMFSRLRKEKNSKVPLRMRGASNPGNVGHSWVKKRFVDKETAIGPFVPAVLDDNPFIDKDGYLESLNRLDKVTRDQLKDGIWRNDASGLVYSSFSRANLIQIAPSCHQHILGIDYGATRDACSFSILGWRYHDPAVYVLKSYRKPKFMPGDAAEEAQRLEKDYKFQRVIGDTNGLGAGYVGEARRRWKIPVEAADKNNKNGYIKIFNGDLEARKILIVEPDCKQLIEEYEELPWADEGRSREAEGFNNHCADGTLYGWRACQAYLTALGSESTGAVQSPFTKW